MVFIFFLESLETKIRVSFESLHLETVYLFPISYLRVMGVRIDKYIWATRFFKTRTISTEKVKKKSVKLNGNSIKPSKEVEVGDHINILKNNAVFTFKVKALLQKRVGASRVKEYVSNITPKEEVEKFEMYNTSQSFYRKDGTGKPNKKERRDLKRFLKEEQ